MLETLATPQAKEERSTIGEMSDPVSSRPKPLKQSRLLKPGFSSAPFVSRNQTFLHKPSAQVSSGKIPSIRNSGNQSTPAEGEGPILKQKSIALPRVVNKNLSRSRNEEVRRRSLHKSVAPKVSRHPSSTATVGQRSAEASNRHRNNGCFDVRSTSIRGNPPMSSLTSLHTASSRRGVLSSTPIFASAVSRPSLTAMQEPSPVMPVHTTNTEHPPDLSEMTKQIPETSPGTAAGVSFAEYIHRKSVSNPATFSFRGTFEFTPRKVEQSQESSEKLSCFENGIPGIKISPCSSAFAEPCAARTDNIRGKITCNTVLNFSSKINTAAEVSPVIPTHDNEPRANDTFVIDRQGSGLKNIGSQSAQMEPDALSSTFPINKTYTPKSNSTQIVSSVNTSTKNENSTNCKINTTFDIDSKTFVKPSSQSTPKDTINYDAEACLNEKLHYLSLSEELSPVPSSVQYKKILSDNAVNRNVTFHIEVNATFNNSIVPDRSGHVNSPNKSFEMPAAGQATTATPHVEEAAVQNFDNDATSKTHEEKEPNATFTKPQFNPGMEARSDTDAVVSESPEKKIKNLELSEAKSLPMVQSQYNSALREEFKKLALQENLNSSNPSPKSSSSDAHNVSNKIPGETSDIESRGTKSKETENQKAELAISEGTQMDDTIPILSELNFKTPAVPVKRRINKSVLAKLFDPLDPSLITPRRSLRIASKRQSRSHEELATPDKALVSQTRSRKSTRTRRHSGENTTSPNITSSSSVEKSERGLSAKKDPGDLRKTVLNKNQVPETTRRYQTRSQCKVLMACNVEDEPLGTPRETPKKASAVPVDLLTGTPDLMAFTPPAVSRKQMEDVAAMSQLSKASKDLIYFTPAAK